MTKETKDAALREAWELVPWYVNGTLDAPDMARVDALRAADPGLDAEIRDQTRLSEVLGDLAPAGADFDTDADADAAQAASWARIAAVLDQPQPEAAKPTLWSMCSDWLSSLSPAGWALPAAGAMVAVAVAVMVLPVGPMTPNESGDFGTLTDGAAPLEGPYLRVQLTEDADAAAMEALAAELGLVRLDGPSVGRVYTFGGDLDGAFEALQGHPDVALVLRREAP